MIKKVVTGGQTGVDRMGLEVAKELGIPTGGMAPRNYKTELGYDKTLLTEFGLTQHSSPDYSPRTIFNIDHSDGTIIFGDTTSPGTRLTIDTCEKLKKPYITNPSLQNLVAFIKQYDIETLNVAGNRASKLKKETIIIYGDTLRDALKKVNSL